MDNIVAKSLKHVMTPSHHEMFLYLKEALYDSKDENLISEKDYAFSRLYYATQLLNGSRFLDFLLSFGFKDFVQKKQQKKKKKVIAVFFEAINIFLKYHDNIAVGFSYFFLAEAYLKLEDKQNCILYLKESLAILEKSENKMAWAVRKKLEGLAE